MEPKARGRDYLAKTKKAMAGAKINAKINSGAMAPHPTLDRSTMEKMPVIRNVPTAKAKLTGRANALTRGEGQKVGLRSKMEQMPTITNVAARAVKQKAAATPAPAQRRQRTRSGYGVGTKAGPSMSKMPKFRVPRPRKTAKARGLLDNWRP